MRRFSAFAVLGLTSILFAQDYRATILGTVTDPNGAAIPGANVKVTKEDTGVSRETVTNDTGSYTVTALDPGAYTVVFTHQGFQTIRRTNLVLLTQDKLTLNVKLDVGQITQEVTIVGEQELINTATASRGAVIDPIKVTEIPLNGRQAYMLMNLVPGVRFTQRQFGAGGFSGTRAWDVNGNFTMNGGRTGTNQFLLNGAPISTNGTFNIAPNVEAIQEMKVMVNTYDSQFGRSGGGHVNTTLKAGSNDWHGSAFDFWRNRILDANARQNNAAGTPRGFRNQHQYGGIIGGPIRKNKDFIFVSFEGWQERTPFPVVSTTIPSDLRNGENFTRYGVRIFDPLTSRLCSDAAPCLVQGINGVIERQPFPNNTIPASRISPVGRAIANLYPTQNFTGPNPLNQNFIRPDAVGRYRYEQPMARYDRVVNDANRFNFIFTFQDGSEYRNGNGFEPPAQNGNMPGTVRRDQNYILSWQNIISPTKLWTIQASFNRFQENFPDVSDPSFTIDKLGIRNLPVVGSFPSRLAPRVQVAGMTAILGNQFQNASQRQQLNFQSSIAHTKGRHNMKYGGEWATIIRGNQAAGRPTGQFDFNAGWTQQFTGRSQGALDGAGIASLLLGFMNSNAAGDVSFIDWNDTFLRREPYVAGFFQDDWKVTDRLTLNLGLRYDIQYPMIEIQNRVLAGFDFNSKSPASDAALANWRRIAATTPGYAPVPQQLNGGLQFAGVGGNPRRPYNFDLSNIQPRIGFAYRMPYIPRTVWRGGFGIFHRTATQGNLTTGFSQRTPFIHTLDAGLTPSACAGGDCLNGRFSLANPFPDGVIPPTGSSLGLATNIGRDANFDGRQRLLPRTWQWSLGFEHEIGWGMVLEASYIGSQTNKETRTIQLNDRPEEIRQQAIATPAFFQQQVPNPFFGVLPNNTPLGIPPTISRWDTYRHFPQFTGIQQFTNPWGRVWYHGLQVRFEKRMLPNSKLAGMTWILNYTWSKQMENFLREEFAVGFRNFNNVGNQLTDIDVRQQFTLAGVYDIPVGKGRVFLNSMPKALDMVLGGWNYNLWMDWNSGVPTGLNTGWDFTCGNYQNPTQNELAWFENGRTAGRPNCYVQRGPFTMRTAPARHGRITDPTAVQFNMAIAKKLAITERISMELRGEAFNAFNTPIRQGPNTDPNSLQFGILPVAQFNFPRNVQIGARVRF